MPYITTAERIGIKKGKKEVAINAVKIGLSLKQIHQITGLSFKEIKELQNIMKQNKQDNGYSCDDIMELYVTSKIIQVFKFNY